MRSSYDSSVATVGAVLWRQVAPICLAYALVGISFGAITVSAGIPGWVAPAMSAAVFAGSAQFAAIGIVMGGGGLVAAILAGLVINARMLAYGIAVADATGRHRWHRFFGAHLITDVNTALVLGVSDPCRRRRLFWGAGGLIFVCWNMAVLAGVMLGDHLGDVHALGLDAVLPAILLALVADALHGARVRAAVGAGALASLAGLVVLPPGWPVLASLLGCTVLAWPCRRPGWQGRP